MTPITKFFMKRPTLFWSLMVGILLIGTLSYLKMPKLEDPAVPIKQAMVVVVYPGADAYTLELDVAQVMEAELQTLPNVDDINTECIAGRATFTIKFVKELPKDEVEQQYDLVRRKVSTAAMKLPQGCMSPIVVDDMMDVYGLFYAFMGDGYTYAELDKYARLLRRELLTVNGVKRVNIAGTRGEVINITFTPDQLQRNGLLPVQIMLALQGATQVVDGGLVNEGDDRLSVRVTEGVKTVDDIRNLLIATPEGKKVRLGDLADIERAYSTPQSGGFFVNSEPALAICITLENDAIVPDVGKAVDAKVAEVMAGMPVGITTEKIFFQPDKVSDAMSSFMINLLESVLIVVIVLVFSMGWRSGLIIGFGLVLTVALSFPILSVCGTTLQRISLGAFIVAMGMLVDNAVVIMDGILVDKNRGLREEEYLYRIGRNTALPLLGATMIAAATFLPIYLTPGSVGEFAGDLFLVICVSLLVSWLLALVQVPVCARAWLPAVRPDKVASGRESSVHRTIRGVIERLVRYKKIALPVAVAVFALCCWSMTKVRQIFFPDFDYKQFVVECFFSPQSNPESVREQLIEMGELAAQNPLIERVAASMGGAPARYCFVRPMTSGGDRYGELIIDCEDYERVVEVIPQIRKQLRETYPDAYIRIRKYNFSISTSHMVEVEFGGPDPAVLRRLAAQAESIMVSSPLVDPYSVQNNWNPVHKELVFEFSQEDARRAGVSRGDIGNAVKAAGEGYPVGVIYEQEKILPINLRMRNTDGSHIDNIASIPVWSMLNINSVDVDARSLLTGAVDNEQLTRNMFRTTTVGNVVDSVSVGWSEGKILRLNSRRVIEAECDPDPENKYATPASVEADIREAIESIHLPAGYTFRWVGEGEMSGESKQMLAEMMPMTMILILLVLLLLFNNWRKVILILICFPFVICGIAPMLLITDTPFTFMAILGFMGLIGMMVKNSIVLVDEINRLRNEDGQPEYQALINATVSRVRPVLLASITTIVGMIPLMGDPMYGSLAVTIIGGLAVGTIVTLMLLPLFYSIFFRVKQ
ncbi:MAG: efflux RND transporter permease subunit [Muribaculaceae bacterium]|nr:efflux RND transporter permease subunit [Muribaculaceae bacterium]